MYSKRLIILSAVIVIALIVVVTLIFTLTRQASDNHGTDGGSFRHGELRVDFIDVGKGDCILIRSKNHAVLIDTGYKDTADDVFDFLDASDVSGIDELILTHYDKDHIGGAKQLLSQYPVKKLYIPDYEKDSKKYKKLLKAVDKNNVPVECVSEEITFSADHVRYTVMPSGVAYNDKTENDNDMSLLVTVVHGNDSCLFTGDIEEAGIRSLLQKNGRTYDLLKIPHHGRMEKNTKALLESVKPKYAVITDDEDNRADSKLCRLLQNAGIDYYRTSENGTVTITGNGSGMTVHCDKNTKSN